MTMIVRPTVTSPRHDDSKNAALHNDASGRASTLIVSSNFRDSRSRNGASDHDGTKLFPIRPLRVKYDSALQIRTLALAIQ